MGAARSCAVATPSATPAARATRIAGKIVVCATRPSGVVCNAGVVGHVRKTLIVSSREGGVKRVSAARARRTAGGTASLQLTAVRIAASVQGTAAYLGNVVQPACRTAGAQGLSARGAARTAASKGFRAAPRAKMTLTAIKRGAARSVHVRQAAPRAHARRLKV
eukprot:TRINITY_DN175_c0_g2_i1.p4 TRINITY_DN175_c0_g2~~TRINITY_DN175_c0_g2_i1.p4  ORF type:complete len:164 (-),score=11.46 TRINITY_DN175_c0_g2_i1:773-1264(-)